MRHTQEALKITALALFCMTACSSSSTSPSSSSGTSNFSLKMTSSTLASSLMLKNRAPQLRAGTSCTVAVDGTPVAGKCYTPTEVTGYLNKASLGNTGGGIPVRLLGGGNVHGLEAVFIKSLFDLKTSPTLTGEDSIQDGTASQYDNLTFDVQALETVFVATGDSKYFHVRTLYVAQAPSTSTVFSACGLSATTLTLMDSLGVLYTDITASAGDILVCIKSNSTDTCEDSDYQWVDDSGNLQATRPDSPKQLTGTNLITADNCSGGDAHPDMDWGHASLVAVLTTPVKVSAAFESGVKNYKITNGGTTTSGKALTVTLDVNTTESLFVPTSALSTDLSATTEENVLLNIDKILMKPIYTLNNATSPGTGDLTYLSATATLTVE